MSAGSNLVVTPFASSHALAARITMRRAKPTSRPQRATPALRAERSETRIELVVARGTIWGARSCKDNEEPRANTGDPKVDEQVHRQSHPKNDAKKKRSHSEPCDS